MITSPEDAREMFETNAWDLITTPGKFEGQPIWVPYFWEASANEDAFLMEDGSYVVLLIIRPSDAKLFEGVPEYGILVLHQTTRGDVYSYEYSEADLGEIEQKWGFDPDRILRKWTYTRVMTGGTVKWGQE